jgi:RNA polymerase sigma-70 factor (ECF subfamily)
MTARSFANMGGDKAMESKTEDAMVVAAARADDESAFGALVERYRRELQVHCYRMLDSFEDSEDLAQETFLRAWRKRASFEGRSTFRAWLYRIATNACLDFLDRHPRQPLPRQVTPNAERHMSARPPAEIPWLQPYPDRLLEPIAARDTEPDAAHYVQRPSDSAYRAQCLDVLRIEGGKLVEITTFVPELFPAFGLPMAL